jgi:hypothetical protein
MKMEAVGSSEMMVRNFTRIHGITADKRVTLNIGALKARNEIWSGNISRMQMMRTCIYNSVRKPNE